MGKTEWEMFCEKHGTNLVRAVSDKVAKMSIDDARFVHFEARDYEWHAHHAVASGDTSSGYRDSRGRFAAKENNND